jgi:hypothetical protein
MDNSEIGNIAFARDSFLYVFYREITEPIWHKFRTSSVQNTSFVLQTEEFTPTAVNVGFVIDKEEVVFVEGLTSRPRSAQETTAR